MSKVCKKVCDADKICNPKTGRSVLRSGAIGKEILGLAYPKASPKASPKPQQAYDGSAYFESLWGFLPSEKKEALKREWMDETGLPISKYGLYSKYRK